MKKIDKARQLNKTEGYRISQRMRKKIEELFGEAKEFMGLRRAKFRGRKWIKEQVLMTATVQNIKRMVKLFFQKRPQEEAVGNYAYYLLCNTPHNLFLFLLGKAYKLDLSN